MTYITSALHQANSDIRHVMDCLALDLIGQATTVPATDIQEGDIIIFGERHVVQVAKIELELVTLIWLLEDKVETFEWERLRLVFVGSYLIERSGSGTRLSIG